MTLSVSEARSTMAQNMLHTAWTARPHEINNHALEWGAAVEPMFSEYHGFGESLLSNRRIGTRFP